MAEGSHDYSTKADGNLNRVEWQNTGNDTVMLRLREQSLYWNIVSKLYVEIVDYESQSSTENWKR